jgi:hypothetical protein
MSTTIVIPDGVTNGMMDNFHRRGLDHISLEENLLRLANECSVYHEWLGKKVTVKTDSHIITGMVTGTRMCGNSTGYEVLLDIGMLDAPYILTDVPASEVTVVAVPCPDCIA